MAPANKPTVLRGAKLPDFWVVEFLQQFLLF
jgi:hypothetical protein